MGLFSWLFGKPLTPAQLIRKHQRSINKAVRNLDRERFKMEQQEKKLIADIKKSATAGQMEICKIAATDLVRTRSYIKKFMLMKANLQAVSIKILTLQSQQSIGEAILGVTVALRGMNQQMKLPQVKRILMAFERQVQVMDLKEEMVSESMDAAMGEEDQDTESDELVAQVLDELGLQLQHQLPELPGPNGRKNPETQKVSAGAGSADANDLDDSFNDIQARLDKLRRE